MHYSGKRSVNFIVRASFAIKMSQVTLLLTGTLSRILSRYNSWSRIDISSETFFMACHLAEITPFFLHFVIGMGIKHSSKDEDLCHVTAHLHRRTMARPQALAGERHRAIPFGVSIR